MLITWRFKETHTQEHFQTGNSQTYSQADEKAYSRYTERSTVNSVRERDTGRLTERQALGRETEI